MTSFSYINKAQDNIVKREVRFAKFEVLTVMLKSSIFCRHILAHTTENINVKQSCSETSDDLKWISVSMNILAMMHVTP
jgi:hypothetical protein